MTRTITLEDGLDPIEATCEAFVADNACTALCKRPAVSMAPFRSIPVFWRPVCQECETKQLAQFGGARLAQGVRPLPRKQVLVAVAHHWVVECTGPLAGGPREVEYRVTATTPEELCDRILEAWSLVNTVQAPLGLGIEIERVWNTRRKHDQ